MAIFLGIDGGGTQTTCLVGTEDAVLGRASAAASNVVRVGEAAARNSLEAAVRLACAAAGVAASQVKRTCVGAAGAARGEIAGKLHRILQGIVAGQVEVVGDMVIALEAAFDGQPGVALIAGTGSIAYGRNPRGETARAGGWGFAVSDEGSGHWIGRAAVAAALRAHDAGERTVLLSSVTEAWKVQGLEALVSAANALPPPDFAALFPRIVAAADQGDASAAAVLNRAGVALAQLAGIVLRRLWSTQENIQVAMSGGVFHSSALVRQTFCTSLGREFPQAAASLSTVEPAMGALYLARKGSI